MRLIADALHVFIITLVLPAAAVVAAMGAELMTALGWRPPLDPYPPGGPWYPPTLPPLDDTPATLDLPPAVVAAFDDFRAMIDAWGTEGPA